MNFPLLLAKMFAGSVPVQEFFRQPCCWGFMGVTSLTFLRDTVSQQTSCSIVSYSPSDPCFELFPVS